MMNTYLITGASGFIGSHLAERLLKEGNKVINVDSFNTYYEPDIKITNVVESCQLKVESFKDETTKEERLKELGDERGFSPFFHQIPYPQAGSLLQTDEGVTLKGRGGLAF